MKLLRLVIFFVLTLALPSLGLAAVSTTSPCQMSGMASISMDMAGMDCGHTDSGKVHQPCKMDASCKACDVYRPSMAEQPVKTLLLAELTLPHPATPILSHDPDGLWRPPQAR